MSLKGFHILFITLATLLTLGLGVWCVRAYLAERADLYIGLGGLSFAAAVALVWYGIHFFKKIKRLHL